MCSFASFFCVQFCKLCSFLMHKLVEFNYWNIRILAVELMSLEFGHAEMKIFVNLNHVSLYYC